MSRPPEDQDPQLLPELERELELALRAAWQPAALDPVRHERILELALEDPLAPPTEDELVESERLRQALEGDGDHPHLLLAQALASAARPELPRARDLPPPALERGAPRGRVVYVAFGAATALLAAAAALVLVIGSATREQAPSASAPSSVAAAISTSRSSAALFQEPFTLEGTTARMDRITSARERELRENRYLAWGVR